jgi:hypothetical protein
MEAGKSQESVNSMTYTLIAVRDGDEQKFTNLTESDADTLRIEFEKGGCTVSILPEDE